MGFQKTIGSKKIGSKIGSIIGNILVAFLVATIGSNNFVVSRQFSFKKLAQLCIVNAPPGKIKFDPPGGTKKGKNTPPARLFYPSRREVISSKDLGTPATF